MDATQDRVLIDIGNQLESILDALGDDESIKSLNSSGSDDQDDVASDCVFDGVLDSGDEYLDKDHSMIDSTRARLPAPFIDEHMPDRMFSDDLLRRSAYILLSFRREFEHMYQCPFEPSAKKALRAHAEAAESVFLIVLKVGRCGFLMLPMDFHDF